MKKILVQFKYPFHYMLVIFSAKLMFRFNVECTEYARLYERTYLEELQKKIGEKIEFLDLYAHQQRIASENKESK